MLPVQHGRTKVSFDSNEAIDKELDYLWEEKIIIEQIEPKPWVSLAMYPMKPNGESGCA